MRLAIILLLIFNCSGITTLLAQSSRIYVDETSMASAPDGSSWQMAYTDLQSAINAAELVFGEIPEIWVAEGVYVPSVEKNGTQDGGRFNTFFIDFDIKLYGGFAGWESQLDQRDHYNNRTILSGDIDRDDLYSSRLVINNGNNVYTIMRLENRSIETEISGFYFRGGNSNLAGTGFSSRRRGGALWLDDVGSPCNPFITDCIFEYNAAIDHGGAIYNHGAGGEVSPTFDRCIFRFNTAGGHGGAMLNNGFGNNSISSPEFRNCLFHDNKAGLSGGAMYFDGGNNGQSIGKIFNSTIVNNVAMAKGGALRLNNTDVSMLTSILNTIFWGNSATLEGNDIYFPFESIDLSHSIHASGSMIGQTLFASNTLQTDPLFLSNSFHLSKNSPAFNFGHPTLSISSLDIDKNKRTHADTIDCGAFEYLSCGQEDTIYVDQSLLEPGDGFSWQSGHKDLSLALQQAQNCDEAPEILVAEGFYVPSRNHIGIPGYAQNTFAINSDLLLTGGFPSGGALEPNPILYKSILSGDRRRDDSYSSSPWQHTDENSLHVVSIVDATMSATINDITIQGGNALINDENGGGVIVKTDSIYEVAFNNCNFQYNSAKNGAAVYGETNFNGELGLMRFTNCTLENNETSSNGTVSNGNGTGKSITSIFDRCIFRNNTARSGGAFYQSAFHSANITNCIFDDNHADQRGGAISSGDAFLNIGNSTFYNNTAQVRGGAINSCDDKSIFITNSISWNNTASGLVNGFDLDITSDFTVEYSLIEEVNENASNLADISFGPGVLFGMNPNFKNSDFADLSLQSPSPAINAGNNSIVNTTKDVVGAPRIQNGVDMGAYEHIGKCPDTLLINPTNYPEIGKLAGEWIASDMIQVTDMTTSDFFNTSLRVPIATIEPISAMSSRTDISIYQIGCIPCNLYASDLNIQAQIDNGCSPMELYNAGIPVDSLYGKIYEGGILFYLDTLDQYSIQGMVCAIDNPINFYSWGCLFFLMNGMEIGTGATNLLCGLLNNAMTEFESNAHQDWKIPSIGELFQMFLQKEKINETTDLIGSTPLLPVTYLSSTDEEQTNLFEGTFINVKVVNMHLGTIGSTSNDTPSAIRPIRYF